MDNEKNIDNGTSTPLYFYYERGQRSGSQAYSTAERILASNYNTPFTSGMSYANAVLDSSINTFFVDAPFGFESQPISINYNLRVICASTPTAVIVNVRDCVSGAVIEEFTTTTAVGGIFNLTGNPALYSAGSYYYVTYSQTTTVNASVWIVISGYM